MHLADAFIQSILHCFQVTVFTFLSALAFPGNRTHDLGIASYYLSYRKAVFNSTVQRLGVSKILFIFLKKLILLLNGSKMAVKTFIMLEIILTIL